MADKAQLIKQEIDMIKDVTIGPLQQVSRTITSYLPQILGALGLLLAGWLVAMVLRKLTSKALRAMGFDVIAERTGMTAVLERGRIHKRLSEILGWGVYCLILFSTLVAVFNTLGLDMASMLIQGIVFYIPSLLIALLLLSLGFFASRYIDTMVTAAATALNLPAPDVWGRGAQSLILFMAGVMVLNQLGIATRLVTFSFLVLLSVVGLAAVGSFGLGTKEIAGHLTAGQCLRHMLQPGDTVQYADYEGYIEKIGGTHVSLRTDQGVVTIPNTVFLNATIVKRSPTTAASISRDTTPDSAPLQQRV